MCGGNFPFLIFMLNWGEKPRTDIEPTKQTIKRKLLKID